MIEEAKRDIEKTYNPASYREYLKKIYTIKAKNESVHRNLVEVERKVVAVEKSISKNNKLLHKNNTYAERNNYGSSSSRKRGESMDVLRHKKSKSSFAPHNSSLLNDMKKSVCREDMKTPEKHGRIEKSGSLGRTTASSVSSLAKNSKILQKPLLGGQAKGIKIFFH